jgi:hypothetical protein
LECLFEGVRINNTQDVIDEATEEREAFVGQHLLLVKTAIKVS